MDAPMTDHAAPPLRVDGLDPDALMAALRFHFEDHTAGDPGDHTQCVGDIAARYNRLRAAPPPP